MGIEDPAWSLAGKSSSSSPRHLLVGRKNSRPWSPPPPTARGGDLFAQLVQDDVNEPPPTRRRQRLLGPESLEAGVEDRARRRRRTPALVGDAGGGAGSAAHMCRASERLDGARPPAAACAAMGGRRADRFTVCGTTDTRERRRGMRLCNAWRPALHEAPAAPRRAVQAQRMPRSPPTALAARMKEAARWADADGDDCAGPDRLMGAWLPWRVASARRLRNRPRCRFAPPMLHRGAGRVFRLTRYPDSKIVDAPTSRRRQWGAPRAALGAAAAAPQSPAKDRPR